MCNPLVSVIIPNYCHAKYLDQRMQSILNQTYQNFEVIILDDASPDNGASKNVIERYRKNPHVSHIVYNEQNSGNTFLQWKRGFELAKGELIWIAESDDLCDTSMLQLLVDEFRKYDDCVLAYSTLIEINDNGDFIGQKHIYPTQHYSGKHYLKHYLALANFVRNASGAVFKASALKDVDKRYVDYIGAGDYLFWVEVAKQGSVSIVNQQLDYFRIHEGAVTSKRDADGSNFRAEKEIYAHIKSLVYMDWFHNKLALTYRARRIFYMRFMNEEVKQEMLDLWNCYGNWTRITRRILRLFDICLERYNYYI